LKSIKSDFSSTKYSIKIPNTEAKNLTDLYLLLNIYLYFTFKFGSQS